MLDFAALQNAYNKVDYPTVIDLLDKHFGSNPTQQYNILKETIQHALAQGQQPNPATQQSLQGIINSLKPTVEADKRKSVPLPTFTFAQIQQWQTDHCLRPTCTQTVLNELLVRRQSVNLTGDIGHGKSRLLKDLQEMVKHQNLNVALLDLKEFRLDYEHFLQSMSMQLGLPNTEYTRFEDLVSELSRQKDRFFLLMIDNLEILNHYQSNDPRYNARFVESLNFLKNLDNTRLLCASREWLKQVVFSGETSILSLHPIAISPLSQQEIQAELQRQLSPIEHPFLSKPNEQRQARKEIQQHPQPCTILAQLISRLKTHYPHQKFKDLLDYCLQHEK